MKHYSTLLLLVTLLLQCVSLPLMAQNESKLLMTIGCLTDTHADNNYISKGYLRSSVEKTLQTMNKEENIDVLVLGGDYTGGANGEAVHSVWTNPHDLMVEKTETVFKDGKNPYVVYANGNHEYMLGDSYNYNSGDYYSTPMRQRIGELTPVNTPSKCANECFYEWTYDNKVHILAAYHYCINGFDFVVLNTGRNQYVSDKNYFYSKESVDWIGKKLDALYEDNPGKTVFFVLHIPFSDSNSISSAGYGQQDDASEENSATALKTILARYPNVIMLYGHDHKTDNAYIREKTSQRITRYGIDGSVIETTDGVNYFDGLGKETPETDDSTGVTEGSFYLKSVDKDTYLGRDANDINMIDEANRQPWSISLATDCLFHVFIDYDGKTYNLDAGSGFSTKTNNTNSTDEQHCAYFYKIEDIYAHTVIGTKVSALEENCYYFITETYSQNGVMLLASTRRNGTSQRIDFKTVSPENGTISLSNEDAKEYIYQLVGVEPTSVDTNSKLRFENEPIGVTEGYFYLWNCNAQKYIHIYDVNGDDTKLGFTDNKDGFYVIMRSGTEGLFGNLNTDKNANVSCGGSGYFSGKARATTLTEQENQYYYKVVSEDIEKDKFTASKVSSLMNDGYYVIIGFYNNSYYVLGCEYSSNSTDDKPRIASLNIGSEHPGDSLTIESDAYKYVYQLKTEKYYGTLTVCKGDNGNSVAMEEATIGTNEWQGSVLGVNKGVKTLTLSATPADGYNFIGWSTDGTEEGIISGSDVSPYKYTFELYSDTEESPTEKTLTAMFKEKPAPSFLSVFMGSMDYWDNIPNGNSDNTEMTDSSKHVFQALMIYVYNDRIVFKMKNYGKTGTFNNGFGSVTVNEDLLDYTVMRNVVPDYVSHVQMNEEIIDLNEDGDLTITDNNNITFFKVDKPVKLNKMTYTRNTNSTEWQSWFAPFDLVLDDEVLQNFTFAKLAGAFADLNNNKYIAYVCMNEGDIVLANTPYVFRSYNSECQSMVLSDVLLRSTNTYKQVATSSTEQNYTIRGLYESVEIPDDDAWYALNNKGTYVKPKAGIKINALRHIMSIEDREDNIYWGSTTSDRPSVVQIKVIGDSEGESTPVTDIVERKNNALNDIHDLTGRKVATAAMKQNGIYIINGKKYLIR